VVGLSGVASGILVISANGWMNSPAGFRWVNGHALDVDPIAAMFNRAWFSEALHMILAAFVSTGFAVAGVHAWRMLLQPRAAELHRTGLRLALLFGSVTALVLPLSGDHAAKDVAKRQPLKLAAMEALYETQRGAPLLIGGIPDDDARRVRAALEIPYGLSFLAFGDPHAEVTGLASAPRDQWPNTTVCHVAFQVMVAIGTLLAGVGGLTLGLYFRRRQLLYSRAFSWLLCACAPLGFIAIEAGWTVTEVGRQPWIIYGVLRTADAVTPMPGLTWPLLVTVAVYAILGAVACFVAVRLIHVTESTWNERAQEPSHG
jgi:cytochrome d ubiquinol oxidase subunit I